MEISLYLLSVVLENENLEKILSPVFPKLGNIFTQCLQEAQSFGIKRMTAKCIKSLLDTYCNLESICFKDLMPELLRTVQSAVSEEGAEDILQDFFIIASDLCQTPEI